MTVAGGRGAVNQNGSGTIANVEVYDAEIHGVMAALEAIRASNSDIRARVKYVLLDNSAAVEALTRKTVLFAWQV